VLLLLLLLLVLLSLLGVSAVVHVYGCVLLWDV
jgi:hypothetical protein